jgi:hypothetical protein
MGILGAGCRKVSQDFWKQCKSQAVVNETGDTIYESEFKSLIRNTGDVALNNPRIQEYNTNLSCKITAVNGLVTDPAEPIPNMGEGFVRVPKNARFDGVLSPATIGSEKGEAVTIGIRCEHRQPNLVNTLNSKVETADGFMLVGRAYSNMGVQCPIRKELDIAIYKSCDGSHPGERLMAMDGYLVVEICPRIRVHNKGTQALHDVTVFDDLIGSLSDGLDIGTVPAGRIVDLGRDLDVDTCYMPSAPNEPPVGDHGTPSDPSDDKYDPETATFTNTAVVRARSGSGLQIYDAGSATCSLADKGVPDQN